MSCSQSLRTDHPSRLSLRLYLLSRLMLFSILSRQYFFAGFFFSSYLYPCQKSPSQKIAILFLLCAKSGLPYISGCISNLYPVSLRIFFILISIFVFFPRIWDMTHDLFSGVKMSVISKPVAVSLQPMCPKRNVAMICKNNWNFFQSNNSIKNL